nr:hypothetical protein CFP56_39967 [Quercus suber]
MKAIAWLCVGSVVGVGYLGRVVGVGSVVVSLWFGGWGFSVVSGYQQGSSKEHDRLEDDLKLIGEAQNFEEGTRVENERVQKGVAKGRSCSSTFKNGGGEKELELTGFEVVGQRWRQYRI